MVNAREPWVQSGIVVCAVLALLVVTPGIGAQAARIRLSDVLARTGVYVKNYAEDLAAIVGEEDYVQTVTEQAGTGATREPNRPASRRRVLRSEIALVQVAGNAWGWEAFRDVFEVDGTPVRDRQDRLERLFEQSPATARREARAIADESARYNIGPIVRNFNVPTAVLFFLHPSNQWRFKFKNTAQSDIEGRRCWVVQFEEREKPTIIRTPANKDVPAKGQAWIEPESGRVLRTELRVERFLPSTGESSATLTVGYRYDERLRLLVPTEMDEAYAFRRGAMTSTTLGVAKYSNFRRFVTDARLVVPK